MMFKRKPPYSQEEIADQIYQIKLLQQMRKSSQIVEEIERFDSAIEMAQEVLAFMQDSVLHSVKSVV